MTGSIRGPTTLTGTTPALADSVLIAQGGVFKEATVASLRSAVNKKLRLSSHGYLRWMGGVTFAQGGQTGFSFGGAFPIPGAFRFARAFYYNLGSAPAYVGTQVLIGPTARGDHLAPVDANGTLISSGNAKDPSGNTYNAAFYGWQSVGFDQGSLVTASPTYAVYHPINGNTIGATSIAIPPASGQGSETWGKVWTDYAQIAPIPPQNGGLYHYLAVQTEVSASLAAPAWGPTFDQINNGYNAYSADLNKTMRAAFIQDPSGANSAPNAVDAAVQAGTANGYGSPIVGGIEVIFEKHALTIISAGDSLGDNPLHGCYNGAEAAAAFMTRDSGLPVCSFNMCRYAYTVLDFMRLALSEIATVPDAGAILIQCQSGNLDNQNADSNLLNFSRVELGMALDLAQVAERMGMHVVIVGPCPALAPASGASQATIAIYNTYVATCQEMAVEAKAFGYDYLDRDVIWGYGDGSMRQDPQWWSTSTSHPTAAALYREGTFIQALLTPLLP